mmetsp:Transcript_15249/g.17587  ORF Transcript_15249/g.17587 Transcript_15249/m.17587 type:complete len:109 (+) Transcript_15249:270-596(+)
MERKKQKGPTVVMNEKGSFKRKMPKRRRKFSRGVRRGRKGGNEKRSKFEYVHTVREDTNTITNNNTNTNNNNNERKSELGREADCVLSSDTKLTALCHIATQLSEQEV